MDHTINYEFENDVITFTNKVRISKTQLDALYRIKGLATGIPTFLWQELLRLPENSDSVAINYQINNFKRIQSFMDTLVDSGFFKYETKEIIVKDRKRLELRIFNIHPALLTIIPLM